MNKSKRSWGWKLLNSAWILLSFVGGAWIGFLLIGQKTKKTKWVKAGLIYAVILWVSFIGTIALAAEYYSLMGVCVMIWSVTIWVSIIHSFIANREYLISREVLLDAQLNQNEYQKMRDEIVREYEEEGVIPPIAEREKKNIIYKYSNIKKRSKKKDYAAEPEKQAPEREENTSDKEILKLNINACDEQSLSKLPGVSVVAAKKAIEYRNQHNGFASAFEFYETAGIKPHFIVQLEDLIVCGDVVSAETVSSDDLHKNERKGRILDL